MFHSLAKVLAIGLLFLAAPLFADTWTDPATGTQWEYSLSNSGEATIGKASNAAGSLTIPSTINGHRVTAIGIEAFQGCTNLTSVNIPASVTGIGVGAFSGCTSLTTVTIPDSVTEIGDVAFEGCTSLTAVTIPASVTEIWPNAFSGCTSLTAVTIPDSVTAIGWGAFSGCTSLTSITIPESVTTIGDFSFSDCSNLRHAYLLNKTCKIAPNAFEGSPTEIVFGPPPEESAEMSPYLFWIYVEAGILAVVGVVLLGIWRWRKRKARARLD